MDPREAADVIAGAGGKPRIGLILGSGLGGLAEAIENASVIPYDALPGFPAATVEGHVGRLVLGTLGGQPVACMQGRFHLFEGHAPQDLALPVRALKLAGIEALILTNAAGSLNPDFAPGSLMMLSDHINMLGGNPLVGPNDERFGPRFHDMTETYDASLRGSLRETAAGLGITLHEGVYIAVLGPNFETPAEIRAYRTLGADAVGMSTVPEAIVARHCGLKVAAISTITNLAAGMTGEALSHDDTLEIGAKGAAQLKRLIPALLQRL